MAKEITRIAKLQFIASQAKPGPELAGLGIKMPEFTRQFNDKTKDRGQEPVPVEITVYKDRSFDFKLFTAPASYKILQAVKLKKGSGNSKTEKVGSITRKQLEEIANYKMIDLNTDNLESAVRTIAGTARNMGITVEDQESNKNASKPSADKQTNEDEKDIDSNEGTK